MLSGREIELDKQMFGAFSSTHRRRCRVSVPSVVVVIVNIKGGKLLSLS